MKKQTKSQADEKSVKREFLETTASKVKEMSRRSKVPFDKLRAVDYMKQTVHARVKRCMAMVNKDMKDASFGLCPKKPTKLMLEIGIVTYHEQARLWAEEIFKNSL